MSKDNDTHIIKSQQYEIELNDSSQGYAYQSKVSQVQEYSIQNILKKVMDTYHVTGYLDQYDQITLDLGTVSATNFERELVYKIEEAFIDFFKKNTYDNGSLITGKRKSIYTSQINQFIFFLKNGYMQWDTPSATKPIRLFKEALKNNKETLVTALKKEGKKENIRKRLISQLKDPALEQIVIAVKDEEGVFINQSRSHIVQYQNDYTLVDINKNYFRNAIWEIVLAYVFTEVTGKSNKKNFLKYLIQKIASKYNLTYYSLLQNIVFGVKKHQHKVSKIADFAMLAIELQDEIKETSVVAKGDDLTILESLKYFLIHNALPANTTIKSVNIFLKEIENYRRKDITSFNNVFFNTISKYNVDVSLLVNKFSDDFFKKLVKTSTENNAVIIVSFFNELQRIATKRALKSETLKLIENKIGVIFLQAVALKHVNKTNVIKEFLVSVINTSVLDVNFVSILKFLLSENKLIINTSTALFINEIIKSKHSKKQVEVLKQYNEPDFIKSSERLYIYYKNKQTVVLGDFQNYLKTENYSTISLKMTATLIGVYAKNKGCSEKNLVEWLTERLKEISFKSVNVLEVLKEITAIIKVLSIDDTIIKAITKIKKQVVKTPQLSPQIKEELPTVISEKEYAKLILSITNAIFNRKHESLFTTIENLLEKFSIKYTINKKEILKQLEKETVKNKYPAFITLILSQIKNKNLNSLTKKSKTQYNLNIVEYFFINNKLPWWAHSKSTQLFCKSMDEVLNTNPQKFINWFKKAKDKQAIINLMTAKNYQTFIKQLNPSASSKIIIIRQLFYSVLKNDITGVINILPKHYKALEYLFINYIYTVNTIEIISLTDFIIDKLSEVLKIKKENLCLLLLSRLQYDKSNFTTIYKAENWLISVLKTEVLSNAYINELQKIEVANNWITASNYTNSKVIFETLIQANQHNAAALRYQLKRTSFRQSILKKLSIKYQKEFLKLFFTPANQFILQTVFDIYKKIQNQIPSNKHQVVWSFFIDKVLLKIGLNSTINWSVADWSLLILNSLSVLKKNTSINLSSIVNDVVIVNNNISKQISESLKKLINQKKDDLIDNELVTEVTENETIEGTVFIENAGLILLGPYIPMLFERMGLVENKAFKNVSSQEKAIYILQYAVTGTVEVDEHLLLLNKIICGMDVQTALSTVVNLTVNEKELIDGLLKAIIAHWSAIGNTSVEGFRVSFLSRQGSIFITDDAYMLTVEEKAYDMLLDQIPWSIGQLKLSWMEKLLDITWRTNK